MLYVTFLALFFVFMISGPPSSTLFPYTTLFRSGWRHCLTCRTMVHIALRRSPRARPARAPSRLGDVMREAEPWRDGADRKSTRLNSSHQIISYAVFCLKKKKS